MIEVYLYFMCFWSCSYTLDWEGGVGAERRVGGAERRVDEKKLKNRRVDEKKLKNRRMRKN